jgi:hypothetical protein
MKRPIITTLAGELARLGLFGLALLIACALLVSLCSCWGEAFTAAAPDEVLVDGGALVLLDAEVLEAGASTHQPAPRDAGEVLVDAEVLLEDAGDASADAEDLVDAGEPDAPRSAGQCRAPTPTVPTDCPPCPGAVPMFACCHAGACMCVGAGVLCTP